MIVKNILAGRNRYLHSISKIRNMASWGRLIRFEDDSGREVFGEPIVSGEASVQDLAEKGSLEAQAFEGTSPFDLKATNSTLKVKKLLPILTESDVPIVKCIGLNYIKHSKLSSLTTKRNMLKYYIVQEGGRKPPPYPSVFLKPRTSIAGFDETIPVPKLTEQDQLDYEGELTIVIGKTGKNIPKSEALDYVAGYVAGNDVSARKWQRDPAFAGGVPQWCFAKGFDKYAPLSPVLVSPKIVGNAGQLQLQTIVNGEVRQDTNTNDLLFGVERIIEFISQGTTLEKGTIIMTGTPAGVAMGMAQPKWLKDGDVVEVKIEHLGSAKNIMKFE